MALVEAEKAKADPKRGPNNALSACSYARRHRFQGEQEPEQNGPDDKAPVAGDGANDRFSSLRRAQMRKYPRYTLAAARIVLPVAAYDGAEHHETDGDGVADSFTQRPPPNRPRKFRVP